jgi:uncharacterized protein
MFPWGVAAYAVVSVAVWLGSVLLLGRSPFVFPSPWLELGGGLSHGYSLLLGAAFGASLVVVSRLSVSRFEWARRMHEDFRPFARDLSGVAIVGLALFSASGEELLFRGLGQPYLGLVPQAVIFGALHQMPGPSRWVWASWALLVGLGLGAIFQLTGSLLGPLFAHAIVNGLNLTYLKYHEPLTRPAALGGLLGATKAPNSR